MTGKWIRHGFNDFQWVELTESEEQKVVEAFLEENKDLLERCLNDANHAFWEFDTNAKYLESRGKAVVDLAIALFNKAAETLSDRKSEAVARKISELRKQEDILLEKENKERKKRTGSCPFPKERKRKTQEQIDAEDREFIEK